MSTVQLEVIELGDDFFTGLADKELGVLDDGCIDFLECVRPRHGAKVLEEPLTSAQLVRVEVACSARCLQGRLAHAPLDTTAAAVCRSSWKARVGGAVDAATPAGHQ